MRGTDVGLILCRPWGGRPEVGLLSLLQYRSRHRHFGWLASGSHLWPNWPRRASSPTLSLQRNGSAEIDFGKTGVCQTADWGRVSMSRVGGCEGLGYSASNGLGLPRRLSVSAIQEPTL